MGIDVISTHFHDARLFLVVSYGYGIISQHFAINTGEIHKAPIGLAAA
jgi:hypothetical protein